MKKIIYTLIFLLSIKHLNAQDVPIIDQKIKLNGYFKLLNSINFDHLNQTNTSTHLLHNRLNFKYKYDNNLTITSEFRNRIFYGEGVSAIPNFSNLLVNKNELFDLHKTWVDSKNFIFHSNIERLFVDYNKNKINLRVGRQRINWGIGDIWNPNDIFNAYNFLDYDYEERPGSDAVKLQYSIADLSKIEFVYNQSKNNEKIVATKLFVNTCNYDIQFITGSYKGTYTIGAGWAGSIKNAGFKGEVQYYTKNKSEDHRLNMTMSLDYMFKKGWYYSVGWLINTRGVDHEINNFSNLDLDLSARNLMPTKYNFIYTIQKNISLLSSINFSIVYAPKVKLLILLPTFSYNIGNNFDADLICQSFFLQSNSTFSNTTQIGAFRIRYSF